MGGTGSLAAALARADGKVTALDDKVDAEELATYMWMKAHRLRGYGDHRVVLGTDFLSPGWAAEKIAFANQPAAETFLQHFSRNHPAMHSIETLARDLTHAGTKHLTPVEIIAAVAAALVNGSVWAIEMPAKQPKSRFVTKTNPSAFAPINPKYGTKIDFAYIAKLEGDQWLRGYVPFKGKTGIVAGKSGMTVASGFDIGQWSPDELKKLGLSKAVLDKITPFAAPHNFKGKTKKEVADSLGKLGPVPILQKTEADECDGAVFAKKLSEAISAWDANRDKGVPSYVQLPGGWQTVWLSRVYQGKTAGFGGLARAGKWKQAIATLRSDTEYAERTNQEADLLEAEIPPTPAPAHPAGAAPPHPGAPK